MRVVDAKHFVLAARLLRDKVPSFDEYPFCLPAFRFLDEITFHPKVTFLLGENGSGKSTLLEAIAVLLKLNPEGGSQNMQFATRVSHSALHESVQLTRGVRRPRDMFFLRAESFFNVATAVDGYGVTDSYGGKSLHEQSHGESFLALFRNRFRGQGIYILDEPEAALSPTRQMSFLCLMDELVRDGSQFIVATHSPIIAAYPDSTILVLNEQGIVPTRYEDTEHYVITKSFLADPQGRATRLIDDYRRASDEEA